MAASAAVTINITGNNLLGSMTEIFNQVVNLSTPVGTLGLLNVSTTAIQLGVPATASYVLIVPPLGTNPAMFIGGTSGTATATISSSLPTLLAVPSPATVWIAAAGAVAGVVIGYY